MLTIFGRKNRYCDGVSRRSFLTIGALGLGASALHLADVFRAEAQAGTTGSQQRAVINIFLGGGPPHQDMWDIKTEAPAEIRGEFKPIATSVPGIQIGEVFPRIASMMDKCVVIRSIVGATRRARRLPVHDRLADASTCSDLGGRPSLGAVAARVQGPVDPSVPPFVGLAARTQHMPWSDRRQAGLPRAPPTPPSSRTAPAWPT